MSLAFSRRLAIVFGVLTPLLETVRRWSTWREYPPTLFDDYLLGAFLLYGAWRTGHDARSGQRYLAAAWAFLCGMGYNSFFGQLQSMSAGVTDPAPIPSLWVAVIKGAGLLAGVVALAVTLRQLPDETAIQFGDAAPRR